MASKYLNVQSPGEVEDLHNIIKINLKSFGKSIVNEIRKDMELRDERARVTR